MKCAVKHGVKINRKEYIKMKDGAPDKPCGVLCRC